MNLLTIFWSIIFTSNGQKTYLSPLGNKTGQFWKSLPTWNWIFGSKWTFWRVDLHYFKVADYFTFMIFLTSLIYILNLRYLCIMISVEKSWVEIFCFINKASEAHQRILLKLLLEKFSLLWLNLKLILEMFLLMLDYKKYFPLPVMLFLRTKMVHHFLSHQVCTLWQYGLLSFQTGGIRLEIFLPKNQHTQRKLLNFENWTNGEPQ